MERILLSSKKTALHDDVLKILFLHMDPILPLPRLRMITVRSIKIYSLMFYCILSVIIDIYVCNIFLQVLYHVLGVIPAYQTSIGPALNELCLGLQPDEVAPVCVSLSVCFLMLLNRKCC